MKASFPSLIVLLIACSTKPAGEGPDNTRVDSVGGENMSTEAVTDEGAGLNGDFIPQMSLEGRTVMVMLKGVDMKLTFPAGGEAMEKREDGFGFMYPGQPGTNLNMRSYRFTAHSPPCDTQDFDDEAEIETKTIGENLYNIKRKSEGAAGSMYSTFLYYFERGDICFQFYLDLRSTSPGLVEGATTFDQAKELAEFEAMLAKLEIMEPG